MTQSSTFLGADRYAGADGKSIDLHDGMTKMLEMLVLRERISACEESKMLYS